MNEAQGAVGALFDRFASSYDATRRMLVPHFEDFYGTAVDVATLRLPRDRAPRIADLGAGTGLLTALLAAARPDATFVLVDAAPAMLELARDRLGAAWQRCEVVIGDMATGSPAGPFDAIVTALAVHHLDDEHKQALYRSVHGHLIPGGVFVNAEQVAGPTPRLDRLYHEQWLAATSQLGATHSHHAEAAQRMSLDRPAPTDVQLTWLRDAGFTDVDCFYKSWRYAVFGGWRAA